MQKKGEKEKAVTSTRRRRRAGFPFEKKYISIILFILKYLPMV